MNPFFRSLESLYNRIDEQWDLVAHQYDFKCTGCQDNCCTSLFFHHTFIEKDWLLEGFRSLEHSEQKKAVQRAETYYQKTFKNKLEFKSLKLMCPLNIDGSCSIYPYRPMICRLHGLPHEITRPDGLKAIGVGCAAGGFDKKKHTPLDRTPFYKEMAQIEVTYRTRFKLNGKIKLSIAQMLLSPHH